MGHFLLNKNGKKSIVFNNIYKRYRRINGGRECTIIYGGEKVGNISFIKTERVLYIGILQIDTPMRNQGIGTKVVEYLLNHYKVDFIIGEIQQGAYGFWRRQKETFGGVKKNVTYCTNCTGTIILYSGKNNYKEKFPTTEKIYSFLQKCYWRI